MAHFRIISFLKNVTFYHTFDYLDPYQISKNKISYESTFSQLGALIWTYCDICSCVHKKDTLTHTTFGFLKLNYGKFGEIKLKKKKQNIKNFALNSPI